MFVVILAQSAATSRAYAAKYEEPFSEAADLVGLAAANAAAAFTGTFVVNGSPTKTQIADSAGGRSQLSQLTASAVVLIVLVLLTGPLAYPPDAALAAVVFLIAVELVDVEGMRRILASGNTSSPWPCSRRSRWWSWGSSTASCSPSSPRSSITSGTATARSTASW